MARTKISRNNFITGVLSLKAQANIDSEIYNFGLNICRNFAIKRLGGIYYRSGTKYVGRVTGQYSRLIEFMYSSGSSALIKITAQNPQIEIYSRLKSTFVNLPDGVEFTAQEIKELKWFISGIEFWFHVGKLTGRDNQKSGFYKIEARSDRPEEEFLFDISEKNDYSPGPVYPPSPKRYLRVELNEADNEGTFSPIYTKRDNDGNDILDEDYFKDSDVGMSITFKYVKQYENEQDTRSAGTYWTTWKILQLTESGRAYCRMDESTAIEGGFNENDFIAKEWMISAFDGGINGKGRLGDPEALEYFKGRLYLIKGGDLFVSRLSDDPLNFANGVNADDAFMVRMSEGNIGKAQWMSSFSRLIIGTSSGIYLSDGIVEPTSGGFKITAPEKISSIGVSFVKPVITSQSITFVGKDNISVYEIRIEGGQYILEQINAHSDELPRSGIRDLAWQQFPEPVLYCALNDGGLICCGYANTGFMRRWYEYNVGGKNAGVINVETTKEEGNDTVWLLTKRNGPTHILYSLEILDNFFDPVNQNEREQFFLDNAYIETLTINVQKTREGVDLYHEYENLGELRSIINTDLSKLIYMYMDDSDEERFYGPNELYAQDITFEEEFGPGRGKFTPVITANSENLYKDNYNGYPIFNEEYQLAALFETTIIIKDIYNLNKIYDDGIVHNLICIKFTEPVKDAPCLRFILSNFSCEIEGIGDIQFKIFFGKFEDRETIFLCDIDEMALIEGIIIKKPMEYMMKEGKIWAAPSPANQPRAILGELEIDESGGVIIKKNMKYPAQLNEIPGADGFNGPNYTLIKNEEDIIQLYWEKATIKNFNKVPEEYWIEEDIMIGARTEDNGQYDEMSDNHGKVMFYTTKIEASKIEHLIGQIIAITKDGYDNGKRYRLSEEDFDEGVLNLEREYIGFNIAIGIPYIGEFELTSLEGGSLLGASEGSATVSKNAVLTVYGSRGGQYAAEIPTADNGGESNIVELGYGWTDEIEVTQPLVTGTIKINLPTNKNNMIRKAYIRQNRSQNLAVLNMVQETSVSEG
jgi:hypothetical protein